ncbi:hypothetical protein GQ651_01405 [Alphaproteobacteria bacterium GH1-50]|uniref:Uncharacterized protein n=1 Tax=Kangsaoukella pontilimi TaxID=2691042 RepID=A0A7C9MV04_9RHOB|nr:hypothetical protein [Kangsaoukella pontilimi]MXQ06494.1 hypothetical protein [Kangsaoukella pontilimi]
MLRSLFLGMVLVTTGPVLATASPVIEVREMLKPDFRDAAALEDYRSRLYVRYRSCAGLAEQKVLSKDEFDACSLAYLKIKLSFLHGVTLERYEGMKPSLRAKANKIGYDAYRAWLHRMTAGLRID